MPGCSRQQVNGQIRGTETELRVAHSLLGHGCIRSWAAQGRIRLHVQPCMGGLLLRCPFLV